MDHDGPFEEVKAAAAKLAAQGYTCFQTFTCSNCGARVTLDLPNEFFRQVICRHCHTTTDLEHHRSNYRAYSTLGIKSEKGEGHADRESEGHGDDPHRERDG